MKRPLRSPIIASFILLALVIVTLIGYTTFSPKVVLINESKTNYDELILKLPSSRISFGPIEADRKQTIYFSFQNTNGIVIYQLYQRGKIVKVGSFGYNSDSELGKKISVIISEQGDIVVHQS